MLLNELDAGTGSRMANVGQRTMRFLGRSYMAFVFAPEPPLVDWLAQLDSWLARSPGFFTGRSIVLDLSNVKLARPGIMHLITTLSDRNIRVIGLEGADPSELGPELPPLLSGRPVNVSEFVATPRAEPAPPPPSKSGSMLIDRPVRSG